ncbi:hypothetical protein HNR77_004498 [Paenibacillus sp. JGP012]|uniref:hypothetical protein n=1 Tax=Paenibacillus sp. JGP012 TaxID=2735914 RepID=UPI001614E740|nr:hypothetical protein [Paenibacillus sp. JGP012]MBB6023398.1 hypothetical protein [Paenibacillus sp. JGP012]
MELYTRLPIMLNRQAPGLSTHRSTSRRRVIYASVDHARPTGAGLSRKLWLSNSNDS